MRTRTSLSPETVVQQRLEKLGCTTRSFALIAGFPVSTMTATFNAQRDWSRKESERALDKVERMEAMQASTDLPIDWSKTERVAEALMARLTAQILREQGDTQLDKIEQREMDALR
jgi:hypothetical protein